MRAYRIQSLDIAEQYGSVLAASISLRDTETTYDILAEEGNLWNFRCDFETSSVFPKDLNGSENAALGWVSCDRVRTIFYKASANTANDAAIIVETSSYSQTERFGGSRMDDFIQELRSLCEEFSLPDWDGFGSKPVSVTACKEAEYFFSLLPANIPLPEITVEPSGAVALEWYKNADWVFVISMLGNSTLEYAGLFGGVNKNYGAEPMAETVPKAILYNLQRWLNAAVNEKTP